MPCRDLKLRCQDLLAGAYVSLEMWCWPHRAKNFFPTRENPPRSGSGAPHFRTSFFVVDFLP